MRYSRFMELPPQSVACADEPIAGEKECQSQSDKNQIPRLNHSPDLLSIINFKQSNIKAVSRVISRGSRGDQISSILGLFFHLDDNVLKLERRKEREEG